MLIDKIGSCHEALSGQVANYRLANVDSASPVVTQTKTPTLKINEQAISELTVSKKTPTEAPSEGNVLEHQSSWVIVPEEIKSDEDTSMQEDIEPAGPKPQHGGLSPPPSLQPTGLYDQREPLQAPPPQRKMSPRRYPAVPRYRDDKHGMIAVMISAGYGAGWSTWHLLDTNIPLEAYLLEVSIFDEEIVAALLACDRDEAVRICKQKFEAVGMEDRFNEVGVKDLAVDWVEEGVEFRINEYDGYEKIICKTEDKWWKA
ncbi:hypothetical protein ACLMJK_003590 [Lecanora helva]